MKLPNFLSVETRPFDPTTYEDEIDDEETLDEEGRARLKLKVENTIRWREKFNEKGVFVKESNARFVRWSDGSLSLHLGEEIFNVYKQPLQVSLATFEFELTLIHWIWILNTLSMSIARVTTTICSFDKERVSRARQYFVPN